MARISIKGKQCFNSISGTGVHLTGSSYAFMVWATMECPFKNLFSVKLNITAYIHTNRIHKYLSVRTKRSKFPRFFLLVPNSQEKSSPKKLASIGGKILARLAPSHLAEEISAGLCDRETHIHRNSDIHVQFKEVHWNAQPSQVQGQYLLLHFTLPGNTHGDTSMSLAQTDRQCGPTGNKESRSARLLK